MTTQDQLTAQPNLNGRHQRTYEAIFRHPTPHNLEWHDVRSLLASLANVTEGHNGALQVTRNGKLVILHAPKHKDVASVDDLQAIRHFLVESDAPALLPPGAQGVQLLVVIDHHEAKIYHTELVGSVPQRIVPDDPHGYGRHLRSDTEETNGRRKPERKSFYEAVAATLRGANQVLIYGSGTGESSAMEQLVADLKHNHGDVAKHVVGAIVVDAQHLTEGQMLARAREFFASKTV